MKILADVVTAVLLLSGAVFCLSGAIGLLRFPDTLTRLQASAKAQSLGLVIILLGAAVMVSGPYTGLLLLIAAFQLITAPVTGQILGRIAYRTDAVDRSLLTADELVDHKHRLRAAAASEARRETGADGSYGPYGPDASGAGGVEADGRSGRGEAGDDAQDTDGNGSANASGTDTSGTDTSGTDASGAGGARGGES